MKKTLIKLIAILVIAIITSTIGTTFVEANYQSTQNVDRISQDINTWSKGIRNMEKYGGVMGLNETIDETTLLSQTSNSIDVHMMKNTEYGAAAILAVSTEYGKQPSANDTDRLKPSRYVVGGNAGLKTSTGNVYGVYYSVNSQWTNARASADGTTTSTVAGRYFDLYKVGNGNSDQIEYKVGDALKETRYWQSTYYSTWDEYLPQNCIIYRFNDNVRSGGIMYASYSNSGQYPSRACIVNGDQL